MTAYEEDDKIFIKNGCATWPDMDRDIEATRSIFFNYMLTTAQIICDNRPYLDRMPGTTLPFSKEEHEVYFFWVKLLVRKFRDEFYKGNNEWEKYLYFSFAKAFPDPHYSEQELVTGLMFNSVGKMVNRFRWEK